MEVNASGFSKEIQEFDRALEEMSKFNDEEYEQADDVEGADTNKEGAEAANKSLDTSISKDLEEKEKRYAESIVNNEETGGEPAAAPTQDTEEYDKFDEMNMNKQFRPYRDVVEKETGSGDEQDSDDDDDMRSTTSVTSTIMDPKLVRSKVKKSLLSRMKAEKRRIRNKGESALVTEKVREINDTIKSSLCF